MSAWWVIVFLLVERGIELVLARSNRSRLLERGGREYHPESYRQIVVLHILFLISLIVESAPSAIPFDTRTIISLILFVALQGMRYWCIWALGVYWNTRIIVVPGSIPVRRGPYRFLRHPNYLVVVLEFLVIPLLLRAPVTLVLFFTANLVLLYRRIRLEEEVLVKETFYGKIFNEAAPEPSKKIRID